MIILPKEHIVCNYLIISNFWRYRFQRRIGELFDIMLYYNITKHLVDLQSEWNNFRKIYRFFNLVVAIGLSSVPARQAGGFVNLQIILISFRHPEKSSVK